MPGTITLKPLTANLTRNTEIFGTMDPYCKILLGKQKVEGTVCKNGGKHPQWDETLVLKRTTEPKAHLELKEKDWLLPDGLIGSCEINLQEVENKQRVLQWYPLTYTGKPVGKILLEINYESDNKPQPVIEQVQQFTTGQAIQPQNINNVPAGYTQPTNQHGVQPQVVQIGPGVMHGYHPQMNNAPQVNDRQYQQDNFYNQNLHQDMFAPPVDSLQPGQKYPTFGDQFYPNAYNQPTNNVHEVIDYRNQQTGFVPQNNYPGVTQEALIPHAHHDKEDNTAGGWNPLNIIRGAMGTKN